MIAPGLTDAGAAIALAWKMIETFAAPFAFGGNETFISASIGIALYPEHAHDVETLINHADIAMYRAKDRGHNSCQLYTSGMSEKVARRLESECDLRRALQRNEFLLHYQPRLSVSDGSMTGLEALLRWQHPRRGLVAPGEFVPILEQTGAIVEVGDWVLRTACKQARRWQGQGLLSMPVSVNVSGHQFRQVDFEKSIAAVLRDERLDGRMLELELTESVLIAEPEEAERVLAALKAMGVSVSIDDFGTGYSSLAYLSRFPVDALKIDRMFIQQAADDRVKDAIIVSVIQMARALGLRVVAEGVETAAHLKLAIQHGLDECQGFHFARPMTVQECSSYLLKARIGA